MVTTRQLLAAGLTHPAIHRWARAGRLRPWTRGVYLFGAVVPPLGPEWAGLLVAGEGAVLSHHTAAALWGLADKPEVVDVTTPRQHRPRARLRWHRAQPARRDIRRRDGLPVTSPARTVADLRGRMEGTALRRVVREALYRRLITDADLQRIGLTGDRAASAAEAKLQRLLRRANLPPPQTNVRLHG